MKSEQEASDKPAGGLPVGVEKAESYDGGFVNRAENSILQLFAGMGGIGKS